MTREQSEMSEMCTQPCLPDHSAAYGTNAVEAKFQARCPDMQWRQMRPLSQQRVEKDSRQAQKQDPWT
eukprot:2095319-Amphidinium_carterae.1